MKKKLPDFSFEKKLWRKGYVVVGCDEVGRGAFAGPLVVAGTVFDPHDSHCILRASATSREVSQCSSRRCSNNKKLLLSLGINDSKKLSPRRREELSEIIKKECLCYATASVPVSIINRVGIGAATGIAVRKVVKSIMYQVESIKYKNKKNTHNTLYKIPNTHLQLPEQSDGGQAKYYLLMDAFYIKYVKGLGLKHQKAIKHGDEVSLSIAAASIIAKVERDSYMKKLAKKYPQYGFENHVGYGTKSHRDAILEFGKTEIHREVFVRKTLGLAQ